MAKVDPWRTFPEAHDLQEAFLANYADSHSRLDGIEQSFRRLWYRWRDEQRRADTLGSRLDRAIKHHGPAEVESALSPEERWQERQQAFREIEKTLLANGLYQQLIDDLIPVLLHIHAQTGRAVEVYDPGLGYGGWLRRLAIRALEYHLPLILYGSDSHPHLLEEADHYLSDLPLPRRLFKAEAPDLSSLPDKRFDLVFSAFLLHGHYPGQLARILLESRRISRYGFYHLDLLRSTALFSAFSFLWPLARLRHDTRKTAEVVRSSFRLEELEFILRAMELHATSQVRFGPGFILPRSTFVIEGRNFAEWRKQAPIIAEAGTKTVEAGQN